MGMLWVIGGMVLAGWGVVSEYLSRLMALFCSYLFLSRFPMGAFGMPFSNCCFDGCFQRCQGVIDVRHFISLLFKQPLVLLTLRAASLFLHISNSRLSPGRDRILIKSSRFNRMSSFCLHFNYNSKSAQFQFLYFASSTVSFYSFLFLLLKQRLLRNYYSRQGLPVFLGTAPDSPYKIF